jgi:hypothetical protein
MSHPREMKIKFWLRGPADNPQVEIVGHWHGDRRPGHFSQRPERSIMAELLTAQEAAALQVEPGRWLLPGTPP